MRKTWCVAVLALGLLLWGSAAWSQQEGKQDKKGNQGQDQKEASRFDKYFKDHDKNNDGSLDRDELPEAIRKDLKQIDNNNDGKVSREELRQYTARMHQRARPVAVTFLWVLQAEQDSPTQQDLQKAYENLRKLDGDNDGKLSTEEIKAGREKYLKEQVNELLKECDSNNDGKISQEEAKGSTLEGCFGQLDRNSDNSISKDELMQAGTAQQPGASSGSEKRKEPDKKP